jgi:hypothetical protein
LHELDENPVSPRLALSSGNLVAGLLRLAYVLVNIMSLKRHENPSETLSTRLASCLHTTSGLHHGETSRTRLLREIVGILERFGFMYNQKDLKLTLISFSTVGYMPTINPN